MKKGDKPTNLQNILSDTAGEASFKEIFSNKLPNKLQVLESDKDEPPYFS